MCGGLVQRRSVTSRTFVTLIIIEFYQRRRWPLSADIFPTDGADYAERALSVYYFRLLPLNGDMYNLQLFLIFTWAHPFWLCCGFDWLAFLLTSSGDRSRSGEYG